MIFDTSFLIDLMNKDPSAVLKSNSLEKNNAPCFATSISIFELVQGIVKCQKPEHEKQKILEIFASLSILSFDQDSALVAGEIHGLLSKQGIPIDAEDSMIAGIAKRYTQPILTRDKHFRRIKDITIETY